MIVDVALDGGSKWTAIGSKTDAYFDPDGIWKARVKSGSPGRSKALVKGKGDNLPDPALGSITPPVTAQLVNLDSGVCLESVYEEADVLRSTETQFKAKAQ